VTRADLQILAEERIRDADTLLSAGRFSAAYYLSGLAVECALKARIARGTREFEFPDLRRAQGVWHHNLDALLKAADLNDALNQASLQKNQLTLNWNTVIQWQVDSRYNTGISQAEATQMYISVTETNDGVLPWLRTLW
jgi:hypothetical protein